MTPENKPVAPLTWVIISGIGFVLFLGAAAMLMYFSNRFGNIKPPVYFFLLVLLGMISAGFLFGALRSHARYSGKVHGGTLSLSGPVVLFIILIYLGYKFMPLKEYYTLQFTVFGSGTKDELVNGGQLKIILNKPDSQKIENGQASFTRIPAENQNQVITVIPVVDGYYTRAQQVKLPGDDSPVELHLKKRPDSTRLSGMVINQKGQPVANAVVVLENGLYKDTTNNLGNFDLLLPYKEGSEMNVHVYSGNALRYNNSIVISDKTSMTLQLH